MKTMLLTKAIEQGIVTVGNDGKGIVGDYIDYKPEKKVVTLTPSQTGCDFNQRFETEDLHWRLKEVNGQRLLVPDNSISSNILLYGEKRYRISTIELLLKRLYSSHMACKVLFGEKEWIKSVLSGDTWGPLDFYSVAYSIHPVVYLKDDVLVDVSSLDYGSKEKPWRIMKYNEYLERIANLEETVNNLQELLEKMNQRIVNLENRFADDLK